MRNDVRQGHLGMGSHQSAAMLKDEWLTPPAIIAALGGPDSFDLDPCAPIERPWPMAREHYTILDNGLLKPWRRGRVWFNPPYGGPLIVGPWMRRMVEHGHGTALTFARTETDLFLKPCGRTLRLCCFCAGGCIFTMSTGRGPQLTPARRRCSLHTVTREACGLAGQFIRLR